MPPAFQCGLAGLLLLAFVTERSHAYVLQGGQWPQPGGDGTPITITYSYNNFLDGGLLDPDGVSVPPDYIRLVTEEAFGLWAAVAPIHFVEVPDIGTPVFTGSTAEYQSYSAMDFGQIRLNHRYINGTDADNGGVQTTKALAYFPNNFGFIAGDIHFDNADPWAVIGTRSEPDILALMTHELGHALGLGHETADPAIVMFPQVPRRSGPGTGFLHPDDIAGIRAIYGVGVGSVTPLPAPGTLACVVAGGVGLLRRRRSA